MALCTNNCNGVDMVLHDFNECQPTYKGNAYSVAYILCDEANDDLKVDYTASGAWNTILTGLDPQEDVVVVNGVVVALTSEIATAENPYKNGFENSKIGETFTLTITDPNVSCDNWDFYKAVDKRLAYVVVAFKDGRMWVSEEKMQLLSKTPQIENGAFQSFTIESTRTFEGSKTWLCYDTQPAGVFSY